MSMKQLAEQGTKRQAQHDMEQQELDAWKPPMDTWATVYNRSSSYRNNPTIQRLTFETPALKAWHDETHGQGCDCMSKHLAV